MQSGFRGFGRVAMVLFAVLALSACNKTFRVADGFDGSAAQKRVLVMPADVELSVLTAGGLLEPRADWTAQGKTNVDTALDVALNEKGITLSRFADDTAGSGSSVQLIKLHGAVGKSILLHQYLEHFRLPSKKGAFDWTLGSSAAAIRERYNADYALFVHMRDSFTSGGRAAVILVGALLGVGVPGGQQSGFASLVDLKTGQVVWFNIKVQGGGDLREAESANTSVKDLLKGLPI